VLGECTDQVVCFKVQRHQVNRRGLRTECALDGGLLARDVDREVHLEDGNVGSTRETVGTGVQARTENHDGVDVRQGLIQLVIDVALAARDE